MSTDQEGRPRAQEHEEDVRIVRQLLLDFVPTDALGDALTRFDRLTRDAKGVKP